MQVVKTGKDTTQLILLSCLSAILTPFPCNLSSYIYSFTYLHTHLVLEIEPAWGSIAVAKETHHFFLVTSISYVQIHLYSLRNPGLFSKFSQYRISFFFLLYFLSFFTFESLQKQGIFIIFYISHVIRVKSVSFHHCFNISRSKDVQAQLNTLKLYFKWKVNKYWLMYKEKYESRFSSPSILFAWIQKREEINKNFDFHLIDTKMLWHHHHQFHNIICYFAW